jgi:hypothetical protein
MASSPHYYRLSVFLSFSLFVFFILFYYYFILHIISYFSIITSILIFYPIITKEICSPLNFFYTSVICKILILACRLYRIASERRLRKQQDEELMDLVRVGAIQYDEISKHRALYGQRQSRLGTQLSNSITKRVIIMILILIIVIPQLMYSENNVGPSYAFKLLHEFNINEDVSYDSKLAVLNTFTSSLSSANNDRFVDYLVVSPTFGTEPYLKFKANLKSLRRAVKIKEYDEFHSSSNLHYETICTFNYNYFLQSQSMYSIFLTIFVAIMLVGGAIVFTNDAQKLVIEPIERMMNMVEAVAADPLRPLHFDHEESGDVNAGDYETRLLETTIEKITSLLRVGFGMFLLF